MTAPCQTCKGARVVGLPYGTPNEVEIIDVPCPTCRSEQWPHGFPGLAFHYEGSSVWSIEPTGTYKGRLAASGRRSSGMAPL